MTAKTFLLTLSIVFTVVCHSLPAQAQPISSQCKQILTTYQTTIQLRQRYNQKIRRSRSLRLKRIFARKQYRLRMLTKTLFLKLQRRCPKHITSRLSMCETAKRRFSIYLSSYRYRKCHRSRYYRRSASRYLARLKREQRKIQQHCAIPTPPIVVRCTNQRQCEGLRRRYKILQRYYLRSACTTQVGPKQQRMATRLLRILQMTFARLRRSCQEKQRYFTAPKCLRPKAFKAASQPSSRSVRDPSTQPSSRPTSAPASQPSSR